MQHFLHKPVGKLTDFLSGLLVQLGQPTVQAFEFGSLNCLKRYSETGDDRCRCIGVHVDTVFR